LKDETELSLAQRVHLAQRKLISVLNNTYAALGIGIAITVIVLLIGIPSLQFMESFGTWEYRLDSSDGPKCNPDDYSDSSKYPATVNMIEGAGAKEAGMQDGDIITRINDLEIPHSQSLELDWPYKLPEVKPGDTVEVMVKRDNQLQSFMVKTTPRTDDPSQPFLGVETVSPVCTFYFVLSEDALFTQNEFELVLMGIWGIVIIVAVLGGVLIIAFFFWKSKIDKLKHEIEEWEGDYLEEGYYLAFETNVAQGSTDGEKIFNMAQMVFPELRRKDLKPEKWKGKVIGVNNYEFDCFQTTSNGEQLFVVKHFGDTKIDENKLQELSNAVKESLNLDTLEKKIKDLKYIDVMRITCVGRNYDEKLLKDQSRNEILDRLKTDYLFDLILEKNEKYTVLEFEY